MRLMLKPSKPGPIWQFFSSVWLAVGLMAFVGFVSCLGTFAVEEAEVVFYRARWFAFILGTLMLNLSICTLNRSSKPIYTTEGGIGFPWRLSQLPFLFVHLGLLLLFSGAIVTKTVAMDGQMFLNERQPGQPVESATSAEIMKKDRQLDVIAMLPPGGNENYMAFKEVSVGLKNGRSIRGKVIEEIGSDQIVIESKDGKQPVKRADIEHVTVKEGHPIFLNYLSPSEKLERFSPKIVTVGIVISLFFLGLTYLAAWFFADGLAPVITTFVFCFLTGAVIRDLPSFEKPVLGERLQMKFKKYYPHAWDKEQVLDEADTLNPALQLSFNGEEFWLFYNQQAESIKVDGQKLPPNPLPLGELNIVYVRAKDQAELSQLLKEGRKAVPAGTIRVFNKENPSEYKEISDVEAIGKTITVAGQQVQFKQIFKKLEVPLGDKSASRPTSKPHNEPSKRSDPIDAGTLGNPAVSFTVSGGQGEYYSFAWISELNVIASERLSRANPKIGVSYTKPRPLGQRAVCFVRYENGKFAVARINPADKDIYPTEIKLLETTTVELQGQKIDLAIVDSFEKAYVSKKIRPVTMQEHEKWEDFPDAVYVELSDGKKTDEGWVIFKKPKAFTVGEHRVLLKYDNQHFELPFKLSLDKFEIETHPGTANPSEFRSSVTLFDKKDDGKELRSEHDIYMNHTLDYKGYRFFQSSYIDRPGMAKVSIFSVANDPGTPIFYAGCIVLCFGVLVIFFVKPSLIKIEKRMARVAAGLPAEGPLSKEDIAKAKARVQAKKAEAVSDTTVSSGSEN
ncbi:MAG: cytochrome c biogenesis protein ResB [Planctomycetota bacterium]|nr:cytochrome c biogenesis protein ResB [Planctomycetota bacterium]